MSLRTDADREELETLCEEHHLLYREFCDRVGQTGEFTGDTVFVGIGDMLGNEQRLPVVRPTGRIRDSVNALCILPYVAKL